MNSVTELYDRILRRLDGEAEREGRLMAEAVRRDLRGPGRLFVHPSGRRLMIYGDGSWEDLGDREAESKDARGHGSEKRSKFAPASHDEPGTARVETPGQRRDRIRSMKVDPERVKVIRRAMGYKEMRIVTAIGRARESGESVMTPEFLREARALSRKIRTGLCACHRCSRSRVIVNERRAT